MNDEQEPSRPDPDFRVYVQRGTNTIDVTHAVMDVYDIAVNSMDFGSGFLSTDEVGNLRALGDAIGAERFDYQHDKCLRCGHEYERHHTGTGRWAGHTTCVYGCSCAGFTRPNPVGYRSAAHTSQTHATPTSPHSTA
jgi:hypothetical protein